LLGAIGGGEDEDLTTLFDAVEEDEELGDGGDLVLGALGGARGGNRVDLIKKNEGRSEFLSALPSQTVLRAQDHIVSLRLSILATSYRSSPKQDLRKAKYFRWI
jgi:hypothetical protein